MKIALTGATGFVGQALLRLLEESKIETRAWHRQNLPEDLATRYPDVEWSQGELGDRTSTKKLIAGCDAVIHTALFRPGKGWSGDDGEIEDYLRKNFIGTIQLFEESLKAGVKRFVFLSTCAVHEKILDDRPLDEAHPLWPTTHYGAHKAALEKFVSSYGLGKSFEICAIRPTGIYGIKQPLEKSKWFSLINDIAQEKNVTCSRGGKEVHVDDVAKAALLLVQTPKQIAGEIYNCYDRYISEWEVAHIAREILGSSSKISGEQTSPKHQIETAKIKSLGMEFGGEQRLRENVERLVAEIKLEIG